ncbi:MAG TPA: arsenite methyltransferase [Anaerolineales bacterium]|nr:arsenite methyltransferase [Anaerolineales bacterium]
MSDENVTERSADIRSAVRQHYGEAAASFEPKKSASCCGSSSSVNTTASNLYPVSELETLPEDVTGLSMGCGDPITLATLQPGQTVLDLGSGGGIDCFMAAKKVGETGHVIGVDMTAEMLEKARANQARMGFKNVEFRLGEIEHLPVADNTVDVIISNCVVNLSPDKPQVFREAFRVLKSGGKLALSDIVTDGPLPQEIKDSLSAWAGCVAGALDIKEYIRDLQAAGFTGIDVTPVYFDQETIDEYLKQAEDSSCCGSGQKVVMSDGVRATVVELKQPLELAEKPMREAVFSAKITAHKA